MNASTNGPRADTAASEHAQDRSQAVLPGGGLTLALFDLDHTLIAFDSGMEWTRMLIEAGVASAEAEQTYLAFGRAYLAGTLDIRAMQRACFAPLRTVGADGLRAWQASYARKLAPRIEAHRRAWVEQHRAQGHKVAIVSATSHLIVEPLAALFGVPAGDVLASRTEIKEGSPSGEILGLPCFREHKLSHVQAWLTRQGLRWAEARETWFYSDSANDLALLEAVTRAVVVDPDPTLRAVATQRGWPVVDADAVSPRA